MNHSFQHKRKTVFPGARRLARLFYSVLTIRAISRLSETVTAALVEPVHDLWKNHGVSASTHVPGDYQAPSKSIIIRLFLGESGALSFPQASGHPDFGWILPSHNHMRVLVLGVPCPPHSAGTTAVWRKSRP